MRLESLATRRKERRKRAATMAAIATAVISGTSLAARAAPTSLCTKDEKIVYSCATSATRFLSICASKDLSKNAGYLQYRFGPSGKPDLVFPETPRHPVGIFTPGTLSFSGGGAYFRFAKAPYVYTVFSAIGNWGKKGSKATVQGVAVQKDGAEVANLPCRLDANYVDSELGPDFFDRTGLGEPQSDFDIAEVFFPK